MRKNKGITLVALIITIVIMLILVAVSVNILIKSNLIGTAERTGEKYKASAEEEANGGATEINGKKYDSIEDYLKKDESTSETHNWQRTGDTLICNHCNTTLTIGQEINYKDNGKGTTSISVEKAGGDSKAAKSMLNKGIKMASLNSMETLKIAAAVLDIEPTTTQTINRDINTKWIVLGIEDRDKNGTNETLLITTKEPTTETIILFGAGGYNNCIEEINRMCKELYGEEARGMTIEDVNNCLGYTPAGGMYRFNNKYYTTGNLTTKLKDLGDVWTTVKNYSSSVLGAFYDPTNPEGIKDNGDTLGEYELNGYSYSVSSDGTYLTNDVNPTNTSNKITTTTKTTIFGTNNSYKYWLASNGVIVKDDTVSYGPGAVKVGTATSCTTLSHNSSTKIGQENSIRAVVSIKSDIPAVIE